MITAGFAVLIGAMAIVAHDQAWLWMFGVVIGCLLGGYVGLRDSPPAGIENWRTGWEGERRTAHALAPLRRAGYLLLHDVRDRDRGGGCATGNIDHVVVSPAGVFVLDSKWFGGEVSIDGESVLVQSRDEADGCFEWGGLARMARGQAVRLREDIIDGSGVRFVRAVVVIWSSFEAGLVERDNIVFVHGDRLAEWLSLQRSPAYRPDLTAECIESVGACIESVRPNDEGSPWWLRRSWRPGRPAAQRASPSSASAR